MVFGPSKSKSFRHTQKNFCDQIRNRSTLLTFNRAPAKLITFQLPHKCYMSLYARKWQIQRMCRGTTWALLSQCCLYVAHVNADRILFHGPKGLCLTESRQRFFSLLFCTTFFRTTTCLFKQSGNTQMFQIIYGALSIQPFTPTNQQIPCLLL